MVTDGQLSGLVNKGLVVGEVTPEAAVGGPRGLVEDGDTITIDVDRRAVDVEAAATRVPPGFLAHAPFGHPIPRTAVAHTRARWFDSDQCLTCV